MHATLIDTATLAAHLRAPDWLVIDCRFELADPAAGERAYRSGHIPDALYAHLDRDLSGPVTPLSGRHPLPAVDALARTLSGWGIEDQVQVVAYDAGNGMMAARLWWLLRWLGHDAVAVLDGGLAAWEGEGRPLSRALPIPLPRSFQPRPRDWMIVAAAEIEAALGSDRLRLLDARATPRFRGEQEPIDPVAGHIPGALNHPFDRNLGADGRFLAPEELRRRLQPLVGQSAGQAVSYCGSGVTACHTLLALELAGLAGGRLYPGSWSEWIRDASRPVARGD